MTKVIIIEGPDRVGKDSLIDKITNSINNVKVLHACQPNSNNLFSFYYSGIIHDTLDSYYKGINVIHNRSMYGEYVYGTKYRHEDSKYISDMILKLETGQLNTFIRDNELYFVLLTSNSVDLLLKNDDGKSFSSKKDDLQDELNRFDEIFKLSNIKNKLKVLVNDGYSFRSKDSIYSEVSSFIGLT